MSAVHSSDTYYFQKPINSIYCQSESCSFSLPVMLQVKYVYGKVPVNAGGAFATEMCFNLT